MAFAGKLQATAQQGRIELGQALLLHLNAYFKGLRGNLSAVQHPAARAINCCAKIGKQLGAVDVRVGGEVQVGLQFVLAHTTLIGCELAATGVPLQNCNRNTTMVIRSQPTAPESCRVEGWMIVGTGIDLCEISRMQQAWERYGERFLQRIFTPAEATYCQRKRYTTAESLAARFAAKEAVAKALGTGIAKGVGWRDIEVVHLPSGRPTLRFHGRAEERAAALRVTAAHLSLSHSRGLAIASVVLESVGPASVPVA